MGVWVVLGERFHYILIPLVCRDGQFLNHTFPLQVCEGTLPVFLAPVTDNMPFLSQRKETLLQKNMFWTRGSI